jgi:hypothetical protein
MNNKLKAFAILPIAASLTFFGLQVVTSSVAATTGVGETPATTGATAATIEDCEWYLDGVATELNLVNDSGMEYVGDDYTLTADVDDVSVYFSGTEVQDERCSFYDDVRGADVEVSWTGTGFTSTTDDSLDWLLGATLEMGGKSSLDIDYEPGTCDASFDAGDSVSIDDVATSPLTPATITALATATYTPSAADPDATFAKCGLNATYSVVLPGNQTPASPGSSYSFTGPALTTTITVNEGIPSP